MPEPAKMSSSPPAGHQRTRHIPQRTCVACRRTRPKLEMVRIVRTVSGRVEVDSTGKKSGRGAYLCKVPSCWQIALKRNGLSRALKVKLGADEQKELADFARRLASTEEADIGSMGGGAT